MPLDPKRMKNEGFWTPNMWVITTHKNEGNVDSHGVYILFLCRNSETTKQNCNCSPKAVMEMHRWHTSSLAESWGWVWQRLAGEMKLRVGWGLGDQKSEMYSFAIEICFFVKDCDTYSEKVNILIIDCFDVFLWRLRKELDLFQKKVG